MAVKLDINAELLNMGPSTGAFVNKYITMFDIGLTIKPRKGAPVRQMLAAPDDFVQGSTEPWIVDIVCALLKANDLTTVLECGAFIGATTERLARTLAEMGGGDIVACEIDPARACLAQDRLTHAAIPPTVRWKIVQDDILTYIPAQPDESIGLAWVDDDHGQQHVYDELTALLPKMRQGGLICGHDVHGSCALHEVFARFPNSLSLDLPRLGPAGGLGILQVR